jgi:hypothetical protein
MTLDRATVDLGKTEFSSGLTFVALSRAKTFDGLRTVAFDYDRYRCIERGSYVEARREEFVWPRLLPNDITYLYTPHDLSLNACFRVAHSAPSLVLVSSLEHARETVIVISVGASGHDNSQEPDS